MFKRTMPVAAFLIGMLPGFSQSKLEKQMTHEEKKVLNAVEQMTANLINGDIDAVMKSYENKATIVFEPGMAISDGKQSYEIFQSISALKPKFSYSGHEVFVSGDIAIHIAPWRMKGTAPDGSVIEQEGLSLAVLRKQSDGEWLMIIDNPHGQILLEE